MMMMMMMMIIIIIIIIIIRPHRSTAYEDAAYCYRTSSVVCRSVTVVSPAKTAEPIEMPFGLMGSGWLKEPRIRLGLRSPREAGIFRGERGGPL